MLSSISRTGLCVAVIAASATATYAGEPYYLISRGLADASVIAVYGWPDNQTPCHSLEKHMNEAMRAEGNSHRFSCVDAATAMAIDCGTGKDQRRKCAAEWEARNRLMRDLSRN